jgi:hypothetical protein
MVSNQKSTNSVMTSFSFRLYHNAIAWLDKVVRTDSAKIANKGLSKES